MDPLMTSAVAILLLPLLSYVLLFFFGEKLPRRGDWLGIVLVGVSWILSLRIFAHFWSHDAPIEHSWNWLTVAGFSIDFGILLDGMSAVMLVVVTTVSFVVHLFSSGYMWGDERYSRYFAFLGWFTFSMLGLVLSNSLFFLYVFWELVGIASYVLIGFFFFKHSAANANKKAFLVNRIGDFGFFLGILLFFTAIGEFEYGALFAGVQEGLIGGSTLTWAGVLLFLGCVGKSAQVPLHVWLPDAMEGPTPVSALIHAATMVAAGVYMVARLFPLFSPDALMVIAYVGGITAIFAATIAIVQTDIKRGLAYSTISQLGYMVMAVGVGGVMAGMFHLTTHAFFKACLFLGSGAVIHAMHHTQDMRSMGGLRRKMPITFLAFLVSTLAISGVPPFAGFWSKDAILASALAFGMTNHGVHYLPFVFALLAASITAFYMFRIVFLTFLGEPRDREKYDHAHEVSWRMTTPLVILGILAVIGGGFPGVGWFDRFVEDPAVAQAGHDVELHLADDAAHDVPAGSEDPHVVDTHAGTTPAAPTHAAETGAHADGDHHDIHHVAHGRAMVMSLIAAGLGILLSWLTYGQRLISSAGMLRALPGVHRWLYGKYFVDEFYGATVVRGTLGLSAAAGWFDKYVIDGIVNGVGAVGRWSSALSGQTDRWVVDGLVNATGDVLRSIGNWLSSWQTGRVQNYFLGLVTGLVVLILVVRAGWL